MRATRLDWSLVWQLPIHSMLAFMRKVKFVCHDSRITSVTTRKVCMKAFNCCKTDLKAARSVLSYSSVIGRCLRPLSLEISDDM